MKIIFKNIDLVKFKNSINEDSNNKTNSKNIQVGSRVLYKPSAAHSNEKETDTLL